MKYKYLKGSEKDFEGAPEWCTHVSKSATGGMLAWEQSNVSKKGNLYQWCEGSEIESIYESGGALLDIIAERRPTTESSWDGSGLPPVGCECEVMETRNNSPFNKWSTCTISAINIKSEKDIQICTIDHNGDFAIFYPSFGDAEFRPTPSEADKKRERITLDMLRYMPSSDEIDYGFVCAIYDAIAAGKIPGVKLED